MFSSSFVHLFVFLSPSLPSVWNKEEGRVFMSEFCLFFQCEAVSLMASLFPGT